MNITTKKNADKLTIGLEGRLDANTSPQLSKVVETSLEGVTELTWDFEKLDYISSAGLRVMVAAHRIMEKQGKMTVENVSAGVMEVLEITGFTDVLTIKQSK